MRFRAYAKMPSASEPREQPSPGGTWVALEKIHGAQLVLGVHAGQVYFGKRKAWLSEEEPFFGWQLLRVQLGAAVQKMVQALGEERAQVYCYGEPLRGPLSPPGCARCARDDARADGHLVCAGPAVGALRRPRGPLG